MRLKDRIFDCLPAGHYGLTALLRLVDVVETEAVPTAAVECRALPRLLVNPGFVQRHAATPEKLLMLVMHEVHHVLLGHTRRIGGCTPADNLVFDCLVNALICRMLPQPEYTALLRDFYADDRFPECLLRPPQGWHPAQSEVPVPPALQAPGMAAARGVYQALYARAGASEAELRQLLRFLLGSGPELSGVRLMGGHDGWSGGPGERVLAEAWAQTAAGWPQAVQPLRDVPLRQWLADARLLVRRGTGLRRQLGRLIARIAGQDGSAGDRARRQQAVQRADSPLPAHDRRALVLRALGAAPLLHAQAVPAPDAAHRQQRVHVYLDVSGSMEGVKDALYGAVLDCAALVHPVVHLFSTEVADIGPAQLRAGLCRSTGGTDIGCVARHIRRHGVRRALLVTDGLVGRLEPEDERTLRRARLAVALSGAAVSDQPLRAVARALEHLPAPAQRA